MGLVSRRCAEEDCYPPLTTPSDGPGHDPSDSHPVCCPFSVSMRYGCVSRRTDALNSPHRVPSVSLPCELPYLQL